MAVQDILESFISKEILYQQYGQNFVVDYLSALIIFLLSIIALRIFKFVVISRLKALAKKTSIKYDDLLVKLVDKVGWPFYAVLSLYISIQALFLPDVISTAVQYLFLLTAGFYITKVVGSAIDYLAKQAVDDRKEKGEKVDRGAVNLLAFTSKFILWSIIVVLIISNMGYDTSALLTGLGIGGIAVALALQTVLSDIFAYFSIHLDKPFTVGDFIVIGSDMGTVERIGIKSTRIRTLQGQELVVSNKELTESRINNFKKMEKRRIVFNLSVGQDTPASKLDMIPGIIKGIIGKMEHAQFDRAHLKSIGDFALIYEIVYYMTTPDYNIFMDTQQSINISLIKELAKQKISMPFPTQTIHLTKRS